MPTDRRRVGDLEIEDDPAHERLEWRIERIGWGVMAAVLAAALAGVTGQGPLSDADAYADGLHVAYGRVERRQADGRMVVRIARGAVQGGVVRLWLDADWLQGVQVHQVLPEPARVAIDGPRVVWTFLATPTGAGRLAPVTIDYTPQALGRVDLRLGLAGGPELVRTQWRLP